jgi:PIN domain nuclease of toxin-antitoxin system
MKILIDTQVFIWLINEDPKLSKQALQIINDSSNQLSISYFSFFEMTIKASIGKLKYDSSVIEDLPEMGIELIMPDVNALRDYKIFDSANKDPFDNFLLATAKNEKHAFMTSDEKILKMKLSGIKLIKAK